MSRIIFNKPTSYFFEKIRLSFKKEEAEGISGVIQWHFHGEPKEIWNIKINDSECEVFEGAEVDATTIIKMERELFINTLIGRKSMIDAFVQREFICEKNFDLGMSMKILFDEPRKYDLWFFELEDLFIPEKAGDRQLIFSFCIENDVPDEDDTDDFIIVEGTKTYRNVVFGNDKCTCVPLESEDYDVMFFIKESDLLEFVNGRISFYDMFLLSKIDIKGCKELACRFPEFFKKNAFVNRDLQHLSVENVMNNLHKMHGDIPEILNNKILCFDIRGKEKSQYFFSIENSQIRSFPKEDVSHVNLKMSMSARTLIELSCYELEYPDAFDEGLITIKGDIKLGIEFDKIFKYRFRRDY